jgi:hypothetical protein
MMSSAWTSTPILGCYGKLSFEGTDAALHALRYVKLLDGSSLNIEISYRIMLYAERPSQLSRLRQRNFD